MKTKCCSSLASLLLPLSSFFVHVTLRFWFWTLNNHSSFPTAFWRWNKALKMPGMCSTPLPATTFAGLAFTRVWKSNFSSLEGLNKPHDWMGIFVLQPNCLLQSRGSCGFGLMPKSTRPGQRHMAKVMLGLFICKYLHAAAVKSVQSINSALSLWHLVLSYRSPVTFCIHQGLSSKKKMLGISVWLILQL